jgi:serine/threonine protein kinase
MTKNKIIHKDLNLENILAQYETEEKLRYIVKLKLTDNSCIFKNLSNITKSQLLSSKLCFVAPEILKKENYDEKSDLWSLGAIIYMLAFKQHPFNGDNVLLILNHKFEHSLQKQTGNEYLDDLIKKLLFKDPKKD